MCGIAGMWSWDDTPDPATLTRMGESLVHRGPDDHGSYVTGHVGFAHRRLAIIDLADSRQPMSDSAGLHVTFNGEILNYRELRAELDYPYRTAGDTEVLLALFRSHGPEGAARLVGQFAYALYDANADELYLFRDSMGILPLYYCSTAEGFWYASEIKALVAGIGKPPPVDTSRLAEYLQRRYVAAPATLLTGVQKLLPGHYLRISRQGISEPIRYAAPPAVAGRLDDATAVRTLSRVLETAVTRNLIADVPVGAFLSGGLDSSLLTSLAMSARPGDRLLTFSAGFPNTGWDELPHARRVAQYLGSEHHEIVVEPSDFERWLEPLTFFRDAPISEPSDIPIHLLARLAHEHVKVALSGEGADELFGGYPKYRLASLTRAAGVVPAQARAAIASRAERRLPPDRWRMRLAVRALAAPDEFTRYDAWFGSFTDVEAAALLPDGPCAPTSPAQTGCAIRRMMNADVARWLPDNLLERADRMAMATSLETRPPFLDPEVVAFARRLAPNQLVRKQQTKWLLKEYARSKLPAGIADRSKVGFRVPVGDWFRTHLRNSAWDRMLDPGSFVTQIFERSAIEQLLARHDSGRSDEGTRIWTLLALEVWYGVVYGPTPR
jgi:asparagine synthase (glutamine-hydrolysing)